MSLGHPATSQWVKGSCAVRVRTHARSKACRGQLRNREGGGELGVSNSQTRCYTTKVCGAGVVARTERHARREGRGRGCFGECALLHTTSRVRPTPQDTSSPARWVAHRQLQNASSLPRSGGRRGTHVLRRPKPDPESARHGAHSNNTHDNGHSCPTRIETTLCCAKGVVAFELEGFYNFLENVSTLRATLRERTWS